MPSTPRPQGRYAAFPKGDESCSRSHAGAGMIRPPGGEGMDSIRHDPTSSEHALEATTRFDPDATRRPSAPSPELPRIDVRSDRGAELQLLSVLGEGGMGQVHLAHQRGLDRDIAVKLVNPKAQSKYTALLLTQEGLITGRLEHPNIVPVHLMGQDDSGGPVIAMKRIEGVPWSRMGLGDASTARWSADPMLRHLEIFLDVCNAVAFAHDRGWVHRDIKPSNVMIGRFGEVYLLDWGISAPIGTGAFDHPEAESTPLGTPRYLAPEQCVRGGVLDERTDVFLLGATLHRVLTDTPRHAGEELATVLANALDCPPIAYGEEIPHELAQILNRATARQPSDRYASASDLQAAVAGYLRHRGSIELAREAESMLARLEQLRGQAAEQPALRRTATECRFAFARALKEWPENERASAGLQRCLEFMTEVELGLGQLEAAQELLDEMPARNVALQAELDAARGHKADETQQLARLRRMAAELDPTVGKGPRAALAVAFALLVFGFTALGTEPSFELSPRGALQAMVPFLALYAAALVRYRRQLLSTLLNRRWVVLIGIALAGMTVNRCMALLSGAPFPYMMGVDLFLLALMFATAGATMYRMLYLPAAIWSAGFVAIVTLPQLTMLSWAVSQIGGLLALVLIMLYRRSWVDPV